VARTGNLPRVLCNRLHHRQHLAGQKQSAWDNATETLKAEPSEFFVLEDKASGTNADRSSYTELMLLAENDEFDLWG
jgi:hypothetical protein